MQHATLSTSTVTPPGLTRCDGCIYPANKTTWPGFMIATKSFMVQNVHVDQNSFFFFFKEQEGLLSLEMKCEL